MHSYLCVMKRFITSIVLVIYMVAAVGVSFSFHYCGGHYQSVQLGGENVKGCCDDVGTESEDTDCCSNKVVKIDCKDAHSASEYVDIVSFAHDVALLPTLWNFYNTVSSLVSVTQEHRPIRGPAPPLITIPLFILHRVLRL